MKQTLIFTLIAATFAGTALASKHENDSSSEKRGTESIAQEQTLQNDALIREHFIRVAELAGFEVLGHSNPDSVALNEMVLTVRPQADRVMWMSDHYNKRLDRGNDAGKWGEQRNDEDDD